MGATASREAMPDAQVSDALWALGSPTEPQHKREAAFDMLQQHFVRLLSPAEKMAVVAGVDGQRYQMWQPPPPDATTLDRVVLADKVRGLIFGAALGDAVGLATEFLSRAQVDEFYGPGFNYAPRPARMRPDTHRMMWCKGDWTDDTDQLVLMLQSLLHTRGIAEPRDFAQRLAAWRQHGFAELGDLGAAGVGQLTKTVVGSEGYLEEPLEVARRVWVAGGRKNAANGALMRTAISGVPSFWQAAATRRNTAALCLATHADPRCLASCLVAASCVAAMLRGEPTSTAEDVEPLIADALAEAEKGVAEKGGSAGEVLAGSASETDEIALDELRRVVLGAAEEGVGPGATGDQRDHELRGLELDEPRAIGYTYKCLGAGLWALRSCDDFATTIRQLTAEGGDADTNAAVGGGLLGCRLGFSALPGEWVAQLEHRAWLEAHVQKLLVMLALR